MRRRGNGRKASGRIKWKRRGIRRSRGRTLFNDAAATAMQLRVYEQSSVITNKVIMSVLRGRAAGRVRRRDKRRGADLSACGGGAANDEKI